MKVNKDSQDVISDMNEMNIVEEFLNVDSSLQELESNGDFIRMEMNIVEFPIFSKSNNIKKNQIKKYYFSSDKESYLEIIPAYDSMIPGELEERVFIALTKIYRNNGFKQTFYCTLSDIYENMNITSINTKRSLYAKVKAAISKLQSTSFNFKDLFYSNEINKIYNDLIKTNILNFRVISLKDATSSESNFFTDKRIKEVYKITLSEHFHDNITRKGYLAFDADELLNIKDPITRSIFTMITKWRYNKLFLSKPAFFIARRIPLAWENPRRTVLRIEKSLIDLKKSNHILGYELVKKGTWETAEFKMYFSEEHNKMKNSHFYEERAISDKMIHMIEDRQNDIAVNTPEIYTDPQFIEVLDTFPEVARKLKSLPQVIREALKKYDYKYVHYTAEYTAFNCKASYIKYFKDALLNNWAEAYIAKKESFEEKRAKKQEKVIEDAIIIEEEKMELPKHTWEEFLLIDPTLQGEIENKAYESFLLEAGSKDNKTMQGIFKKSKKALILKMMNNYNLEKPTEGIEAKKLPKIENVEIVDKTESFSKEYASFSHFILEISNFVEANKISIDLPKVIQVFKLLGEYEDFTIKLTFNEATKIGEIIKK